ncbi:MAG TPA: pirin family protein [Planctomycetota bacterium]|nr:pirin family protein [Planctomycetota bacterium]
MTTTTKTLKRVLGIVPAPPRHWVGDGFAVHSMFTYDDEGLSPFLLLDYAPPKRFEPSSHRRGVGEHPHRGFETVTIAFQGEVEHRDSSGATGKIGAGDVQWMTAASGVVHEEFQSAEFTKKGGTFEMVQLWVNLPARLKMSKPRYQDLRDRDIPAVQLPDDAGILRVIAGEHDGKKGPAKTFTPVELWDLRLKGGRKVEITVPEGHTTALLVRQGEISVNGSAKASDVQLVVLDPEGGHVSIETTKDSNVLLIAGEPLGEPVVGYGPFVMNTEAEIQQAFLDYRSGKMGSLD